MNTPPIVSVILPNYNHSLYLKERLDSIFGQTYQNFELIILDDFSTDNSREIIEQYSDSEKISHIEYAKVNSGSTFKQWNKGFKLAKGKYIWIAESDDYSNLSFLEKLVPLLEENNNAVLAYAGSYLVSQDGDILAMDWDKLNEENVVTTFQGRDFVLNKMLVRTSIYNSGMALFRKDILAELDDTYTTYKSCGDWLFWSRLCMKGQVVQYAEKMNYFRQHLNKVTARSEASGLRFTEGKFVVKEIADMIDLTSIQWKIVIGSFMKDTKRFPNFKDEQTKDKVLENLKTYFNFKQRHIYYYRLDKIFNFSKLNLSSNK